MSVIFNSWKLMFCNVKEENKIQLLTIIFILQDNNGEIENEELRGFLKDLLELVKKDYDAQDLIDFEETILQGVGYDKEGKISRKELTMILLTLAKMPPDEDQ